MVISRDEYVRARASLIEKFPRQFAGPTVFEIGLGWFQLVSEMLAEVDKVLECVGKSISWTRIASKYGSLRADFETDEYGEYWAREIEAILERYEVLSETRCERCGKPGTTLERGGWISVTCSDEHA